MLTLSLACQQAVERSRPVGRSSSIVVITIDTLRADHLGSYGYFRDTSPNIDRVAEEGVLFANVVTTMATTLPAHVSLWTSMYPVQTGVTRNGSKLAKNQKAGSDVLMFAQMLRRLGYSTAAFVSATPVKKYTGIGVGFDIFDEPDVKRGGRSGTADATTDQVLQWLDSEPQKPFFLWVHYFDPHDPYRPPSPYDTSFSTTGELIQFLEQNEYPYPEDARVLNVNNLYDGEIQFVDSQIGRLVAALEESGLYETLTLVILSDHGEGLGQHGRIGHGEIFNEQLFVPLIIKFPESSGRAGQVVEEVVSLVDVVPTLVDVLDLPLSSEILEQFVGRNALSRRRPREYALAQRTTHNRRGWGTADKFALVGRDWKYTLETGHRDWLFDMRQDRPEISSIAHVELEIQEDLRDRLLSELAVYSSSEQGFSVVEETSPEIVEELRALGYLD